MPGTDESVLEATAAMSSTPGPVSQDPPATLLTGAYRGKHRQPLPVVVPPTLSGEEISINEIKHMRTSWPSPKGTAMYVGEFIPATKRDIWSFPARYDYLVGSMITYGQMVSLRYGYDKQDKVLIDGLHRVAIADMLGWESMVVFYKEEYPDAYSHWKEWDESSVGQNYHKTIRLY